MDLSKQQAIEAINGKLAIVTENLAVLDKLTAQAQKLEKILTELKSKESEILKDTSREDEQKLGDLLAVRALIDLKQEPINSLRGIPAKGNNVQAIPGRIEQPEQATSKAGEVVSNFLCAYHQGMLVAFQATVQKATEAFIQAEDNCGEEPPSKAVDDILATELHAPSSIRFSRRRM
jgi:hypothetical protein